MIMYTLIAQNATIQGRLVYDLDEEIPIPYASVKLYQDETLINSSLSDSNGNYSFAGLSQGHYFIKFSYSEPWIGCDMSDAAMVMEFINQQITFSDMDYKAADVDGDGYVTTSDVSLIITKYLNSSTAFPVGEWVFNEVDMMIEASTSFTLYDLGRTTGRMTGKIAQENQQDKGKRSILANYKDVFQIPENNICTYAVRVGRSADFTSMGITLVYSREDIEILEIIPSRKDMLCSTTDDKIRIALFSLNTDVLTFQENELFITLRMKVKRQINPENISFKVSSESFIAKDANSRNTEFVLNFPKLLRNNSVSNLTVYPNPASDYVILRTDDLKYSDINIWLINIYGQKININYYKVSDNEIKLELGDIHKGSYIIKAEYISDNKSIIKTHPIMVN